MAPAVREEKEGKVSDCPAVQDCSAAERHGGPEPCLYRVAAPPPQSSTAALRRDFGLPSSRRRRRRRHRPRAIDLERRVSPWTKDSLHVLRVAVDLRQQARRFEFGSAEREATTSARRKTAHKLQHKRATQPSVGCTTILSYRASRSSLLRQRREEDATSSPSLIFPFVALSGKRTSRVDCQYTPSHALTVHNPVPAARERSKERRRRAPRAPLRCI